MAIPIITPQEMYAAENKVFDAGTDSFSVMKRAGEGVADQLHAAFPQGAVRVLSGPGGNGGDGFVAGARLRALGRQVRVYLLGEPERLSGDVARAAAVWDDEILPLDAALSADAAGEVTLDALFGGGLSRPLEGTPASLSQAGAAVVSVDVPSGLDGRSAQPLGPCFKADLTVTFAALRMGHVLSPGRALCGRVEVLEIGIPVVSDIHLNDPTLWAVPPEACPEAIDIKVLDHAQLEAGFPGLRQKGHNLVDAVIAAAAHAQEVLVLLDAEVIVAAPDGRTAVDLPGFGGTPDPARFKRALDVRVARGFRGFAAACAAASDSLTRPPAL